MTKFHSTTTPLVRSEFQPGGETARAVGNVGGRG